MPDYIVLIHPKALKLIQSLQQEEIKIKIKQSVESLAEYPLSLRQLDVQKLEGFDRSFRIRVGSYRIIFQVEKRKREIFVTKIEKRESVYE